ncbi:MAG: nucleotidyltransferase family protein [Terriglobales bacterium]
MSRSSTRSDVLSVPSQRGTFSKEFDLLCACAGVELAPERAARIANWKESQPEWNEFFRMAEHHGVRALAARNLNAHARGLPPEIEQGLRSEYEENIRRNLWFAGELARIAERFEKKKLQAVPYKGPALAESVYGDLALRNFSDLDFLIAPADFEAAKQALAELGYLPSQELSPEAERLWLRIGYERAFDGPAGRNLVELQWRVLPHFYGVDLRIDDLLARSGRAALGGREVPALAPEDLLLVLCLHAAKHLWMRLIWVCDIAEALRQPTDYGQVMARACALGITRILGVSFWLADNLLHAPLPQSAQEVIAADPEVPALGREFAARLARGAEYDLESSEYFRLILRLRERRRDRWRYLWRLVLTPGAGDVAAVRLPEPLFPLYRVVRLARLVRKLV